MATEPRLDRQETHLERKQQQHAEVLILEVSSEKRIWDLECVRTAQQEGHNDLAMVPVLLLCVEHPHHEAHTLQQHSVLVPDHQILGCDMSWDRGAENESDTGGIQQTEVVIFSPVLLAVQPTQHECQAGVMAERHH